MKSVVFHDSFHTYRNLDKTKDFSVIHQSTAPYYYHYL